MSKTIRAAQSPVTLAGLLALALLVPRAHASVLSNRDIVSPNSRTLTVAPKSSITGQSDATPMFMGSYSEWAYSGQRSACVGCLDSDYRFTNSESHETDEQTFTHALLSARDSAARYIVAYLPAAVPEPSALALLGSGLTIVALLLRRLGLKG